MPDLGHAGDEHRSLVTGWGRTAPTASVVVGTTSAEAVAEQVRTAGPRGVLARGLGRSYGDAAQNAGGTIADLSRLADSIEVDEANAVVTCDAGISLDRLIRELLPLGLFVPVTPGTRQVTIGGAVAADVHGKNHHRDGSIGAHLRSLQLVTGRGDIVTLSPDDELFHATTGGLGLTGVVTRASMSVRRVPSSWMAVDTERAADLDGVMAALEDADTRSPYSVAWIDCLAGGRSLGRGVVTSGDHAPVDLLPRRSARSPLAFAPRGRLRMPAAMPSGILRRQSVAAFNEAWFRKAPRLRRGEPQPLATFFHPLDGVADWNRVYGPAGFVQWQVVVPFTAAAVVQRSVEAFAGAAAPAFLAVLKRFGPGGAGHLSFPMPGWTLALDLPAGLPGLAGLLDRLDEDVLAAGGRVYLAKDSRARPEHVAAMYSRLPEWQAVRHAADPHGVFRSDLARRLLL